MSLGAKYVGCFERPYFEGLTKELNLEFDAVYIVNQPNYNTALYMRLSRDDEGYGDSISIETQRTILRKFAQDNQLRIYDEYIDDTAILGLKSELQ